MTLVGVAATQLESLKKSSADLEMIWIKSRKMGKVVEKYVLDRVM